MRRNMIETVMGAVVLLVAVVFIVFAFRSAGIGFAVAVGVLAAGCLIALLTRQPRRQPGRARSWC